MLNMPRRSRQPIPPKLQVKSLKAPVGGFNTRDQASDMPESDAVSMVNWIPSPAGLVVRGGYQAWATIGPDPVDSIFHYFSSTDVIPQTSLFLSPTAVAGKLFAADKDGIYNVTSRGATPTTGIALSGAAKAGYVYTTMFSNIAGSFLIACSETDGYHLYDGITWSKITGVQVTGVDPADLCFPLAWKRKIWFVQQDSTNIWYLPTDQITGAAIKLDVGPLIKRGGKVEYIANWTIDAGEGIDDYLVIVATNGDVLVYKGSDPSSAATFGLVGQWNIGQVPSGRRGFVQFGGDLLLLSTLGIQPVSFITRGGTSFLSTDKSDYTEKVQPTFSEESGASFNLVGWGLHVLARQNTLVATVPTYASVVNRQYVMNTITNSWGQSQGIPARCGCVATDYFFTGGADGKIYLSYYGEFDNVAVDGSGGNLITGTLQMAYTDLGLPGLVKSFKSARPVFVSKVRPAYSVKMLTNFSGGAAGAVPATAPTPAGSPWGIAIWGTSVWGASMKEWRTWRDTPSRGAYYGSLIMATELRGGSRLLGCDVSAQVGGPL